MFRSALAATVVAVALIVAGCDNNNNNNGSSASADFIADADAICKGALDRHPRPEPTGTQEGAIRASGAAVSRLTEEERGLKRLEAPQELRSDFPVFLRDTHQMQQLAVSGKAAALNGDQGLYSQSTKDYVATDKHRQAIAKRIAFKSCGQHRQA